MRTETSPQIRARYSPKSDATVWAGDCEKMLRQLPDNSTQLFLTSPPYNVGKSYESHLSLTEYLELQSRVLTQAIRILRPGGSLCYQVGSSFLDGNLMLLDGVIDSIVQRIRTSDIKLRNRIVWHFEHGLHSLSRFSGRYETILWYTKGDTYTFRLDDVRVPQKYPGKRSYKGPRKGMPSGNPLGKNPSDYWVIDHDSIWNIPNVNANHVEKTTHPCQFPIEIAARLTLALTEPGDLVVDPFGGAGTTAAVAIMLGRRAATADIHPSYTRLIRARIRAAWHGNLPFRPTREVYTPDPRSAVARLPDEFRDVRGAETARHPATPH